MPIPAAVAVPLLVAGTAVSAVGAISQGNALSNMANYQSQVAANNAKIAAQYAESATQTGETQAYNEGLKQRQQQQAITAGIAAGGVDVNTGSARDVRESQRELGMLDVETVRQQAALQAYGYRTQQTSYEAQSQLETAQAGYEQTAGWMQGAGALLTGGFQLAGGEAAVTGGAAGVNPGTGYVGSGGSYQPTAGGGVF